MRIMGPAVLGLLLCLAPAIAGGYDELAGAFAAKSRDDTDTAIAKFTAALQAGDLNAAYIPAAHRGLAVAYLQKKRCQDALNEMNAVGALAALDHDDHDIRKRVFKCLGDWDAAEKEIAAINDPVPMQGFWMEMGNMQWNAGRFADAEKSFQKAADYYPWPKARPRLYPSLWYAITADRQGKLDKAVLENYVRAFWSDDWPMPVINLFLGKNTPEKVVPVASKSDEKLYAGQLCEANFYVAEWQIVRGNPEIAKPGIEAAIKSCPKTFIEYSGAKVEAARLGMTVKEEQSP